MEDKKIEVSVVIPTLNEEITIGFCVEKALKAMRSMGVNGEVVICDSYSQDKTVELAQSKGARVVYQPLKGYGNAYHKGIAEAKGKIIVIGDADNTYDFSDLQKFVDPIKKNECDMVIGNRLNKTIQKGAMPWLHRYIGTPVMTYVLNLLFGTKIMDCNSGMRSFSKETFGKMGLKSPGWEFASEMVIKAGLIGLKIKNVDISLHKDMKGRKPHLNPWKAAVNNFVLMFTFSSRFLFFLPGLFMFFFGFLMFFLIFFQGEKHIFWLGNIGFNNLALVAASFILLSGCQLLWFSLISRIYIYFHRLNYVDKRTEAILGSFWFSLPAGTVFSAVSLLAGAFLALIVLSNWVNLNFSTAPYGFKAFVLACTLLFFSVQTFFNYFIVNILLDEIRFNLGVEGTISYRRNKQNEKKI